MSNPLVDFYFKNTFYPLSEESKSNPKKATGWCVYVVGNPTNLLFKIGVTEKYGTRIKTLVTQSGCPLWDLLKIQLCPEFDESAYYVESMLHAFFKKKKVFGEWFDLNVRDLVMIRSLFREIEGDHIDDYLSDSLKLFFSHSKEISTIVNQKLIKVC